MYRKVKVKQTIYFVLLSFTAYSKTKREKLYYKIKKAPFLHLTFFLDEVIKMKTKIIIIHTNFAL